MYWLILDLSAHNHQFPEPSYDFEEASGQGGVQIEDDNTYGLSIPSGRFLHILLYPIPTFRQEKAEFYPVDRQYWALSRYHRCFHWLCLNR